MIDHSIYQEPLVSRYTDKDMQKLFSDDFKYTTWRKCWTALAESQLELGLNRISKDMVLEMNKALEEPIDYEFAAKREKEIRHDVMAHIDEFGRHCPTAKKIIHFGATSAFVTDNTELIQQREGLLIIKKQLINTIYNLRNFAEKYRGLVTLGYTHLQPAQPTTAGKRNTLYLLDLLFNLNQIEHAEDLIMARGAKGTVGTQASFLELFDGNYEKVKELDKKIAEKLGFNKIFPVTGQTYTRGLDTIIAESLASIGESAHKFGFDLRVLALLKEQEEPFEEKQVGSSAMAYKRNPMRSERMCGFSRKLMGLPLNFAHTHASQFFERTLDDSGIRRMDIPQTFLLTNAILKLYLNITNGMVVYPSQIKKHLDEELPFIATEEILIEASKNRDRQEIHELLREHSQAAGKKIKEEGKTNDLFERLANDSRVGVDKQFLDNLLLHPEKFSGAAERQTEEFLREQIDPVLQKYHHFIGVSDYSIRV